MLVDCHSHLDHYPDAELQDIVARALASGVGAIVTAGSDLPSSSRGVHLAVAFPQVLAGVGFHPSELKGYLEEEQLARLRELALSSPRVVAISETGLDLVPGAPDRLWQEQAFRAQIRLARGLGLPVIFHSRGDHGESLRVLREEGAWEMGAVMHYFQGDKNVAKECLEMGFLLSLARPLLSLPRLQALVREMPLESLVLESDAFPQPWKGKRENWTEPRHVQEVARKLAELKGIDVAEVARATTDNLLRLLGPRAQGVLTSLA